MAAVKTMMESSCSNSSQFRIICKPKRTFLVRRGGVTRCEAVSDNNNNRVSSLSALEQLKASGADQAEWPRFIGELCGLNHIEEAGVLSTCNRMEIYVVALSWHRGVRELTEWMAKTSGIPASELRHHLFMLRDGDATQHLFEVSAGLDSLVLGEGQILAQVKQVVMSGEGVNGFGRNISVLVVGAGKMGKLVIKHLVAKGWTKIVVVNRSEERVEAIPEEMRDIEIIYKPLTEMLACAGESDVVFTSTASESSRGGNKNYNYNITILH
ncbi:hypothetical protein IFM89_026743 [Coptis chinensis]|uniref:Glutamyl-tRNA reductase N-terminal domain-containing protein n=1 Tax=Coptis chinensis TaxID=261450 RepID=A0A835ID84_9MAGN|nr:hypothetical protein IFM89_026743 [Coptis chinensis]